MISSLLILLLHIYETETQKEHIIYLNYNSYAEYKVNSTAINQVPEGKLTTFIIYKDGAKKTIEGTVKVVLDFPQLIFWLAISVAIVVAAFCCVMI